MSDKTVPQTPPSTTLYPNLVTPPNSDGTIEKPILTYDFDWPDTSNAKVVRGSFRQLVDYSPSPSPRSVAKSQPKRVQRRDRNSSLSAGYDNVKRRGDIENVKESDENRSDNASHNTPQSFPELSSDIPNGNASPEGNDTVASRASTPSSSTEPLPIWQLEINIKEIIVKAATDTERGSQGHAYIYGDRSNKAGYFKIGKSKDPLTREKAHKAKCKLPDFQLVDMVPRGQPIRGSSRLESLAQAELSNLKHSFECRCCTAHKEFFTGTNHDGLETLTRWSSWLERNPYDERFELSPFWRDRLRLLGNASSHSRCPSTKCRSTEDIGASSCQACLRLGLKAWIDVTDYDYFEYECRMRVGWKLIRQATCCMWPLFGNRMLILIDGWEKISRLATFLWAPTTHLRFLLLLVLSLVLRCLNSVSVESILCYILFSIIAYSRVMGELKKKLEDTRLTMDTIKPRTPRQKTPRKASISPGPEIVLNPVESIEIPDKQPRSKNRSASINGPIDSSDIPGGYRSDHNSQEMSEVSKTDPNSPSPFLSPDHATRTVRKGGLKADRKRRKSDIH